MDNIIRVTSYDGQTVWAENRVALYEVGNFLGGGAAGTVYEAENVKTKKHFALKILNPLGYKMLSPSLLRRCTVVMKGKPVTEAAERSKEPITKEQVWWLLNGSTKQYLVAYYSERQRSLNELSLVQCMNIWGVDLPEDETPSGPSICESPLSSPSRGGGSPARNAIPAMPPKYEDFVRRRSRLCREICNMRKISPHENVIRLESVLELAQDSKCTIFLVMELANGGELFDRIKIDCGTVEETAGKFFSQLLRGVRHCHDEGVCHRDLKPENLLLQDSPAGGAPLLKIADFGFSARLAMSDPEEPPAAATASSIPLYSSTGSTHSPTTAPVPLDTQSSPMRVLLSVVGSPFYVAPEVLQARGYDGRKADSWSLGVILYAMLAGNLPFAQELASCKRFRQFCIWAREQSAISPKFWQDPALQGPSWLFSVKFSTTSMVRGLIVAMLLPDPADRISVKEAQQHSWCRSHACRPPVSPPAISDPHSDMHGTVSVSRDSRDVVDEEETNAVESGAGTTVGVVLTVDQVTSQQQSLLAADDHDKQPTVSPKKEESEGTAKPISASGVSSGVTSLTEAESTTSHSPTTSSTISTATVSTHTPSSTQPNDNDPPSSPAVSGVSSPVKDKDSSLSVLFASRSPPPAVSSPKSNQSNLSLGLSLSASQQQRPQQQEKEESSANSSMSQNMFFPSPPKQIATSSATSTNPSPEKTLNDASLSLMTHSMDLMDVESDDEDDDEEDNDLAEQFQMDDSEEGGGESALKRSKKSPGTGMRRFDRTYSPTSAGKSDSCADEHSSSPPFSYHFEQLKASSSCTEERQDQLHEHERGQGHAYPPHYIPRHSPYEGSSVLGGGGMGSTTSSYSSTYASSPRRSNSIGLSTPPPPPLPTDMTSAIPAIMARTPDLLDYQDHAESLLGLHAASRSSSRDGGTGPTSSRSIFAFDDDLGTNKEDAGACSSPSDSSTGSLQSGRRKPPSFHDAVKRSTRFITSVPAGEVLETVEGILEQCRIHRTVSPIGLIGRVELHWESYCLDVWGGGGESEEDGAPPLCSLHLYQLPGATSTPVIPGSPMRMSGGGLAPAVSSPLYLVEFVRGQLEIFAFKRFYEWIRQRVSELVKRDYDFNLFDQSGSPIQTSSHIASSPLRGVMQQTSSRGPHGLMYHA